MTKKKPGPAPKKTISDVPRLMNSWGYNPKIDPTKTSAGSNEVAEWICPECGYNWLAKIHVRYYDNTGCPACSGKVATAFNNVTVKFPEITAYYDRDYPDNPSLETLLPNSSAIVHWKCAKCQHKWAQPLHQRIQRKNGEHYVAECAICSGKPVKGVFLNLYPDIAKEWDHSSNYAANGPENIKCDSTANYWWKCRNNHCYCMSVDKRVKYYESGLEACPYCDDREVFPGFNSFAVRHSDLLVEWDSVNNYALADPDTISEKNDTPVWWVCCTCGNRYLMSTLSRVLLKLRGRVACPLCRGQTRKRQHFAPFKKKD